MNGRKEVPIFRMNRPAAILRAGKKTLRVEQKVSNTDDGKDFESVYTQDIEIEVRLERFTAPEVAFRYPQPGSCASFSDAIPHVVLSKPELPWERSAGTGASGASSPWLALIAFAGSEKERPKILSGDVERLKEDPGNPVPTRISNATPDQKKYWPEDWEAGRSCRYIDVPWETFQAIAPTHEELGQLAHIQQAGIMEDRRIADARKRLELEETATDATPATIAAARAVLEKAKEAARATPANPDEMVASPDGPATAVLLGRRSVGELIKLCGATGEKSLIDVYLVSVEAMRKLLSRKEAPPIVRLLTLDHWSFTHDSKAPGGFVRQCEALPIKEFGGYISFQRQQQTLHYRGPLLSQPGAVGDALAWEDPDQCLFKSEDGQGVDISFAAAWQMGRLVAMGDPALGGEFARARARWRYQKIARQGNVLLENQNMRPEATGTDLTEEDAVVARRLSRLWLLERVPLHYLVPDAGMLESPPIHPNPQNLKTVPESLSVVHLDPMWADAWCAGAFSVGSNSTGDYSLKSPEASRLGKESGLDSWRRNGVVGLLIRSRVIADWPKLQVDFWEKETAVSPFKPIGPARILRQEKLAPDVMLILVEGGFAKVKLGLPSETLRFAVKSGTAVKLEEMTAIEVAQTYAQLDAGVEFEIQKNE